MLFSSPLFVFQFLPLVLLAYFALDRRLRNTLLLVASLYFYTWGETWLVCVMLTSILANYCFALWVARERRSGGGKQGLIAALLFNIGILVFFKYADWIWESLWPLVSWRHVEPLGSRLFHSEWGRMAFLTETGRIRLPLGISFFTFQAMSYVIDVYRGDVEAQRNPAKFALYKSLFPQLIAGPIVRYKDVHHEVDSRESTWSGFAEGARRFVIGLGKKMLIANAAAEVADHIFGMSGELSTPVSWSGWRPSEAEVNERVIGVAGKFEARREQDKCECEQAERFEGEHSNEKPLSDVQGVTSAQRREPRQRTDDSGEHGDDQA